MKQIKSLMLCFRGILSAAVSFGQKPVHVGGALKYPAKNIVENAMNSTVSNLLKPENKEMLASVLTYHVVAGNQDSKKLGELIKEGNGTAALKTIQGAHYGQ